MARLVKHKLLLVISLLLLAQMVIGPGAALGAPSKSEPVIHIVQAGENLFRISLRYGTTVNAIMAANNLASTVIYVGQRLVIPGSESSPAGPSFVYVVKHGDTLTAIAWRYGTTVTAIARVNGLMNPNAIYVGQRLRIPGQEPAPQPPRCGVWYTVQRGDTVSALALRYGTTVWAIVSANNLASANRIYVGQRLSIPCGGSSPSPAPVSASCANISSPRHGSTVGGAVTVRGTANVENFWYYKFEYRKDDGQQNWITYDDLKYTPVVNGVLGEWNLNALQLPDGWYWFRVVIVDWSGNYPPPCEMRLYVRDP
ncbi:MAG: LysM peptidoglycan-binding domain-containing protein [Chloroflexota bacterium]